MNLAVELSLSEFRGASLECSLTIRVVFEVLALPDGDDSEEV